VTGTTSKEIEAGKHGQIKGITYTLTLKLCNTSDKEVKIKIASNAWLEKISNDKKEYPTVYKKDEDGIHHADPDATRKGVIARSWKNPETGDGQPLTLAKKGDKGSCKEYKLSWRTKPSATYIDVYLTKPDGTLEDKFDGGGFNKSWDDIKLASFYPEGPKENYCCTFPIPYPMALESVWDGPIKVAIGSITGLPEGIEMLEVFPHIGVPYHLDLGDRGSVGAMILRQTGEVKGRRTVAVNYHVVEPVHLSDWGRTHMLDIVPGRLLGKAKQTARRRASTKRPAEELSFDNAIPRKRPGRLFKP
jgi:hypothetical protein